MRRQTLTIRRRTLTDCAQITPTSYHRLIWDKIFYQLWFGTHRTVMYGMQRPIGS